MWSFNSRAQLRLIIGNPRPVKGLEQAMIPLTPELLQLLARLAAGEDLSALSSETFDKLLEAGLIVATDQLGPEVRFAPELTGEWPRLAPAQAAPSAELRLIPGLDTQASGPRDWPGDLLSPRQAALWLPEPAPPGLQLPWYPDAGMRDLLTRLQSGQLHPSALPEPIRAVLSAAGILSDAPIPWPQVCRAARHSLQQQGYVVLRGLLNPLQLAGLREYIRELSQAGYFEHDQEQVQRRGLIYNHPLMSYLHNHLTRLLAPILPDIAPSYSMLALYQGGAELKRHIDRDQCAWNVSWMLDAEPEAAAQSWPLYFEHQGELRSANPDLGDLVLYSGTRTLHWRQALPAGQRVAVGLFHFVASGFRGKRH